MQNQHVNMRTLGFALRGADTLTKVTGGFRPTTMDIQPSQFLYTTIFIIEQNKY